MAGVHACPVTEDLLASAQHGSCPSPQISETGVHPDLSNKRSTKVGILRHNLQETIVITSCMNIIDINKL